MPKIIKVEIPNFGDSMEDLNRGIEYCIEHLFYKLGFFIRCKRHQLNRQGERLFNKHLKLKIIEWKKFELWYQDEKFHHGKMEIIGLKL